MPTVSDVRDSLAAAITAGTGLRATALVQDVLVAPIAVVSRRAFDPRLVFSQSKTAYQFTVTVYADRTDERSAQQQLDDWVDVVGIRDLLLETGDNWLLEDGSLTSAESFPSVVLAIQDDALWGVTVHYAQVTRIGEVQAVIIGESNYLAIELEIEVVF